ncbi:deoxynucleoside kinase [Chitinophaga sancti]|uniref:Deoxyadenosine/deoxycytidine kinase n=1 Tax=Chitinophaga sancti TaxID=1004 RepID=A0A1K1RQA6_9BACT|nr:deoxynucleoside kinase [Chitinophaga sancti]WQD62487.1 deoxynucleoside kinase [Chitinophaga sancti]WQG91944.1 deoxynucleoside kinase [Chitinophaga sancti]SFW74336.1 Deoxyadenosine/deoxycytidine kinase [Chitinophaga sancti]
MNYKYITIEGNIGAGKTTLATRLAKHFGAQLILEEFADNPFLPKFYEKPQQYAFPLELFFMAERYKQLKEMLQTQDMFNNFFISDYLFIKSLLFAKVTLKDEEYNLYQKLFDIINPQLLQPELLIFLNAPITRLQQNIKDRNRLYEQSIPDSYLGNLQDVYMQYIRQHPVKTLMVDTTKVDFMKNPKDFDRLLKALEQDYPPGINYF